MYYDYQPILSRNALISFLVGERGDGKTFGAKKFVLNRYIEKKEEFAYIRRYSTEFETIEHFFDDLYDAGLFLTKELKVKKSKKQNIFYVNNKPAGYGIPLSTANTLKSTAYAKVKTIIFDEFILDPLGTHHYLKNEASQFCDLIETIARTRDVRVLCLANALSVSNPYFEFFNISLDKPGIKMYKNGLIAVDYIQCNEYRKFKQQTRFGQLLAGTDYAKYAVENQWYRDNSDFIKARDPKAHFCYGLMLSNKTYGVWTTGLEWFISEAYDPSCKTIIACRFDDHGSGRILLPASKSRTLRLLANAYQQGCLYFDNQMLKNNCLPILKRALE